MDHTPAGPSPTDAGPVRIGLVADPAAPTVVAHHIARSDPADAESDRWDVEVLSEPFTFGFEDLDRAVDHLAQRADERRWDVVIGLTELPLRDDSGRYLLLEADERRRVAVLSLPALGGLSVHARADRAVGRVVDGLADAGRTDEQRVRLSRLWGRWRLLLGMIVANRPWLLVPGLKSALVAALTTGAVATVNSTVWVLADSLSVWRLSTATVASTALVVVWLIVDGQLWERPRDGSREARERARLYNASTLGTLVVGVLLCYATLYLVNLAWAAFVLDPSVLSATSNASGSHGDLFVLAWFVASVATVGGGLGTGLESDEAIRAAAYSRREEDRRERLAKDQGVDA